MSRLAVVAENDLPLDSLKALLPFRMGGKLSPVYGQIANSDAALNAYLNMENALKKSSLSLREIEAIKLLVSQINHCDHCLAVHHMKATAAGLSDEDKLTIRRGESIDDQRLAMITRTVKQFFDSPGVLNEEQFAHLRDVGLSDAELVDMAMVAATIFFTNVFNHLNNTQTSLPDAPDVSNP